MSDVEPLIKAIQSGDVEGVRRLLIQFPNLAGDPLGGEAGARTALHVVADWPGFFPNGAAIARALLEAGANPNARGPNKGSETPLHWAASSDDAEVAGALIDGGADIEAADGSIGTPLDNAIGYECWNVARLLVTRGARVDKLWHAAPLGMLERLTELLDAPVPPAAADVCQAFWHACAGGQRRAAELLLARGADINWIPDYSPDTPLDATQHRGTQQENVSSWLREQGARPSKQ